MWLLQERTNGDVSFGGGRERRGELDSTSEQPARVELWLLVLWPRGVVVASLPVLPAMHRRCLALAPVAIDEWETWM